METATEAAPAIVSLERFLGDPRVPASRLSYRRVVEADERDELADGALDACRAWGVPAFAVPAGLGGRLTTIDELLGVVRAVSRRDLSTAVAFGSTMVAAIPVWLWGSDSQRSWLAGRLLEGGLGSFAVSERTHGSDLFSGGTRAVPDGGGYRLSGEKWPIGNGSRGCFATVLARTGRGAFSMLVLDKARLPAERWRALPRVRTAGLRGHELSGLAFDDCPVPADAILDRPGAGMSQVLRAVQVSRLLTAGLSLGSLDGALRVALEYARERRLYGAPAYRLPVIRDGLLRAYLDILIAECVALPVARAVAVAPQRLGLWSSVVKFLVPVLVDEAIAGLAAVLGARHYLREDVADGAFQKIQRDHAIVGVFEGTTQVNLAVIADNLGAVTGHADSDDDADRLAALFTRSAAAPHWRPEATTLRLVNRGGRDEITQSWPAARDRALETLPPGGLRRDLAAALRSIEEWRAGLRRQVAAAPPGTGAVRDFALGRTHCLVHAAAACLHAWSHNRVALDAPLDGGEWLLLCLQRILQRLQPDLLLAEEHTAPVERAMLDGLAGNRLFSLEPVPLGGAAW